MSKKNGKTKIIERDYWGIIRVYTKEHPDIADYHYGEPDPEYVFLTVSSPDDQGEVQVFQLKRSKLLKALL